jgi:hypothetical protein
MATIYEIPLSAAPQSFTAQLAGVSYQLTAQWRNAAEGCWILDIADAAGNPLVQGIPLVTGCDLLAQYRYLGIGGQLRVQTDNDPDAMPTFDNLGNASHLYFVV